MDHENAIEREVEKISSIDAFVQEGIVVPFVAPQRRGKTLSMVIWLLDSWQHQRKIFSNIQLGFPHAPLNFSGIKLEDGTSQFRNGAIGIDELNFYFDKRRSMKGQNLQFAAFLLQQKKQGCNIYGTTHDLDFLDLRYQQTYDYMVRPTVRPAYPKAPEYLTMRISNGPMQGSFRRKIVIDCRPFLGLYDTFAVYDPFAQETPAEKPKAVPKKPRPKVEL